MIILLGDTQTSFQEQYIILCPTLHSCFIACSRSPLLRFPLVLNFVTLRIYAIPQISLSLPYGSDGTMTDGQRCMLIQCHVYSYVTWHNFEDRDSLSTMDKRSVPTAFTVQRFHCIILQRYNEHGKGEREITVAIVIILIRSYKQLVAMTER